MTLSLRMKRRLKAAHEIASGKRTPTAMMPPPAMPLLRLSEMSAGELLSEIASQNVGCRCPAARTHLSRDAMIGMAREVCDAAGIAWGPAALKETAS